MKIYKGQGELEIYLCMGLSLNPKDGFQCSQVFANSRILRYKVFVHGSWITNKLGERYIDFAPFHKVVLHNSLCNRACRNHPHLWLHSTSEMPHLQAIDLTALAVLKAS